MPDCDNVPNYKYASLKVNMQIICFCGIEKIKMAPMILMNVDYFIKQFGYFGSKRYYPDKHYLTYC